MTAVMEPEVIDVTDTEPGKVAHIVKTEPGESAAAIVLEARIYGYSIEALCGYVWVPSQNPESLPICEKCKEIYDMERMMNEDLSERPKA